MTAGILAEGPAVEGAEVEEAGTRPAATGWRGSVREVAAERLGGGPRESEGCRASRQNALDGRSAHRQAVNGHLYRRSLRSGCSRNGNVLDGIRFEEHAIKIAPVRTEADYDNALGEIDRLMDAEPGTPRGDRLDVLTTLVEAYEASRWRIDAPDPIEAIKLRMEQRGLPRHDLQRILGPSGRVSEILNRKRPLSIQMVRRLHEELDIPAESFMRPSRRRRAGRTRKTTA